MGFQEFKLLFYKWLVLNGFKIFLILFAVIFINKFFDAVFNRLLNSKKGENFEQNKNFQTIFSILNSGTKFVVFSIAMMLILQEIGINIGPILAAAGVLGFAVGFGSQRLVEDVISGFIILINNQIRVGDIVQIDDKIGCVEKITLNLVILRDDSGNVHFIRNGKINVVTNMTKDFSYYVSEIKVSYNQNFEKVIDVIKKIDFDLGADEKFAQDILEPIEILGLDKFENSALVIKARIKTRPTKQWTIGREFNLRLKKKFDELHIEMK